MGLQNFTGKSGNDDDDAKSGPPSGLPISFPQMPGSAPGTDDDDLVAELLIDYNQKFATAEPTLHRDALIERTLAVLIGRTKPNALLVGPAGVGKTKIVEDIARRIAIGDPLIPAQLKDHVVYELPISNLIAGSSLVGALEQKVKAVVEYASDPKNKVILFMDEIHQVVSSRDASYSKIAQILKPAMARGDLQVIGATTTQESRSLDADPAFNRRFSRLSVDELSSTQTLEVLRSVRPGLVAHYDHQVTVSDTVLQTVIRLADDNSRVGSHRPDNAITLLDRAMAERVLTQKRLITQALADGEDDTAQLLQSVPNLPLTEKQVHAVSQQMLTGQVQQQSVDARELADHLKRTLCGQDKVIDEITDQIGREQLEIYPRTTPLAWLLAGASGVGKTQTAKLIAERLTGQAPIVLNMTEFNHSSEISRIVGAPAGYVGSDSNAELPFDSLESNPRRVILLDEFEKADRAVQRLFLQALDEGTLTTSQGRVIDFSKAIIIATTNAARESLDGHSVGFGTGTATVSRKSLNNALTQHFDAELLGRFSLVVGFKPITEEIFRDIVESNYRAERERILVAKPRFGQMLPAVMPADDIERLTRANFVPSQGARPALRAVRTWIEDFLVAAQTAPVFASAVAEEPRG